MLMLTHAVQKFTGTMVVDDCSTGGRVVVVVFLIYVVLSQLLLRSFSLAGCQSTHVTDFLLTSSLMLMLTCGVSSPPPSYVR